MYIKAAINLLIKFFSSNIYKTLTNKMFILAKDAAQKKYGGGYGFSKTSLLIKNIRGKKNIAAAVVVF